MYKELFEGKNVGKVLFDEEMKKHTTFKIGGKCDVMILPTNIDEIQETLRILNENNISYFIIGNGSNILVTDKGIRGAVIKLARNFANVEINGNEIKAQAGCNLVNLSNSAYKAGLTGMEFASGIPANLGGAVFMNAGAYDGEMKDIVKSVKVLDKENNILTLTNEEMKFTYRHSICQDEGYIVLETRLELVSGDKELINEKMQDFKNRRREKQPVNMPSAGSAFKRPVGYYAGKLVQDAGYKGFEHNGAKVSEKHSGFIVNTGNASSKSVLELVEMIQKDIYKKFNVNIEMEIKVVGEK